MDGSRIVSTADWRRAYRTRLYRTPQLSDAVQVAEYSMDYETGLKANSNQHLRTYCEPDIGDSLLEGINDESFQYQRSGAMFRVLHNADEVGVDLDQYNLITGRTCMKLLALAIYNNRSFLLYARQKPGMPTWLWKGEVEQCDRQSTEDAQHAGMSFEKKAARPTDANGTCEVGTGRYIVLIDRTIGENKLLFSAEMDCCEKGTEQQTIGSMERYIELKIVREPTRYKHLLNYHNFKAAPAWIQSFIAGVDNIIIGRYNSDYELVGLERRKVSLLHQTATAYLNEVNFKVWNPDEILCFLDHILTRIRDFCSAHQGRLIRITHNKLHREMKFEVVPEEEDPHHDSNN